jgi:hypothetical protein
MYLLITYLSTAGYFVYVVSCGFYLNYLVYDHFTFIGFFIGSIISWILNGWIFPLVLMIPKGFVAEIFLKLLITFKDKYMSNRSEFISNVIFST